MSADINKSQKVIRAKGFGFTDLEKKIPATPDTLFHLASITKTLEAVLIMQLVEQGKLSLASAPPRLQTELFAESESTFFLRSGRIG